MKSATRDGPRGKIKRPHMEIRRRTWRARTVHMGTWKERTRRFNVVSGHWTGTATRASENNIDWARLSNGKGTLGGASSLTLHTGACLRERTPNNLADSERVLRDCAPRGSDWPLRKATDTYDWSNSSWLLAVRLMTTASTARTLSLRGWAISWRLQDRHPRRDAERHPQSLQAVAAITS